MADQQRKVSLTFEANTSNAQSKIDALTKSINKVMDISTKSTGVASLDKDLQKTAQSAALLEVQLKNAFNTSTGKLDLTKFNDSLKSSGMSLEKYQASFSKLGRVGEEAFSNLARSIATAEIPLKRTNGLLNDFATTMKNTVKWQLSSSIMHGFLSSVQSAMSYAQHLNQNLTDIRIVTGQSADEMARFAEQANRSAKELSTTTNQYAQAALIFYQQGLSDKVVKERTDAIIKMANVTGDAAKDVSSYMTAIWNNFDDGSKSIEYYADVITKLGAATAASSAEIAGGLEKFAAVGNTIGLSYEYATAMLTTIIDKTRQSEDVVGTALKTILARVQGLNLGDTLDDGTTLNKYSSALASVGVQIKDTSGQLRDMDAILDDLGAKWQTLSKDTQVALAQVVGGVRQYNQIISLMDNWDAFEMNVDIAFGAEGELDEQAKIYAESWEASQRRVQAALESIYSSIIDDGFFIKLNDLLANVLTLIDNMIEGFGGIEGVLASLGAVGLHVFNKQISSSISNMMNNIRMLTKNGRQEIINLQKEAQNKVIESASKNKNDTVKQAYTSEAQAQLKLLENAEKLTDEERAVVEVLMQQHRLRADATIAAGEELQKSEALVRSTKDMVQLRMQLAAASIKRAGGDEDYVNKHMNEIQQIRSSLNEMNNFTDQALDIISNNATTTEEKLKELNTLIETTGNSVENWSEPAQNAFKYLSMSIQEAGTDMDAIKQSFDNFGTNIEELSDDLEVVTNELRDYLIGLRDSDNLNEAQRMTLDKLITALDNYERALDNLEGAQRNAKKATDDLKQSQEALEDSLDNIGDKGLNTGEKITTFAEVVTDTIAICEQVKGLFEVWGDEQLSFGEKVLTTATVLASMIPTIVMLVKNLDALGVRSAFAAANSAYLGAAKLVEAGGWRAAAAGIKAYIASLLTAMGPVGWVILAIGAVVTAIVGLSKVLNQDTPAEKAAKNLQKIAEENKKLAKEVKESTKEIEDMYSTFNDYEDAYEALEKLTEGTDSWATALANVKTLAQQIIDAYPILADMIANPDKYGTTLSNIFDENGNIRPEVLEEVETRTVKRTNLDLFGNAAQADENATEAIWDSYTVYQAGVQKIQEEFTVGGGWGGMKLQEDGEVTSTGLETAITEGTFKNLLPLMTEYYGTLSTEERQRMEGNADFFSGANLMEALKMSDYYYNKDAGAYTEAGYKTIADFLNFGYDSYNNSYRAGDRKVNLSRILDLYSLWEEDGKISGEDLAIMDPKALERAILESDMYGLHETWLEGRRVASDNRDILNSMDAVVDNQRMDYMSAIMDTQSEITGLGTGVLTQLGLTDERGNRRGASSFSDVDSIAGMVMDQAVDKWVADVSNELPEPEKIAEAFSLTSTESLTTDKKGNYVLTTVGEDDEKVTKTYTPDQMRRMYAYNQLTEGWAADESITNVGSWFSAATGVDNVAAINALNRYDARGVEGLTLEDLRALNSDEMAPYIARTFEDGELAQKIGVMERAASEGLTGYNYGTINSLYGNAEEDIYAPLRSSIASINAERAAGGQAILTEKEINTITSAAQSGNMDKAIALLHEYGGESQAVKADLESLEATAYNTYSTMSKYSNLPSSFDEVAEAIREVNEAEGEIDGDAFKDLKEAGIDVSGITQIGSNRFAGTASWDSFLDDYFSAKKALQAYDSGAELTDEQKRIFGYSGKGSQEGITWEDYVTNPEYAGSGAIAATRSTIDSLPEEWLVEELTRFGFDYYKRLQDEGITITDEMLAAMASSAAERDKIEIPEGMIFGSPEDYENFVEELKVSEAVEGFINDYATNVQSGLMKSLAAEGAESRTLGEEAVLNQFRQQIADMLGYDVEDITDDFIIGNWELIQALGSNDTGLVEKAMSSLRPEIENMRLNYADVLVRGLGQETERVANYALGLAANAFANGDYSGLNTVELQAAEAAMYELDESGNRKLDENNEYIVNDEAVTAALQTANIIDESGTSLTEEAKLIYSSVAEAKEEYIKSVSDYYTTLSEAAIENATDGVANSIDDVTARILSSDSGFAGVYKIEDYLNVRSAVEKARKSGGMDASKYLEEVLSAAGDKASELASEFANIDWDSVTLADLQGIIENLGLSGVITAEQLESLITAMDKAIAYTTQLTEALNNYASDTSIADKMRNGEALSAEEYARGETLLGAEAMQQLYALNADGSYSMEEGINGDAFGNYVDHTVMQNFHNAAVDAYGANEYFGAGSIYTTDNDAFYTSQHGENETYGRQFADAALSYISENMATLFPEVNPEEANRAITSFRNSGRSLEDIDALAQAFNPNGKEDFDIGDVFNEDVDKGLSRQSEEANEAYEDSVSRIPRENLEQEWAKEGFSEADIQAIDEYGDKLQELATTSEHLSDDLAENADLADEIASEIMRYNRGLETVVDNTENWSKVLKEGNKDSIEYVNTISEMSSTLEDIYDLDEGDLDGLDIDWEAMNEDMKTMAEGSGEEAAEAYQRGMDRILDSLVLKSHPEIDLDTTKFYSSLLDMEVSVNEWQNILQDQLNGIEAGGIIPDALLASLAEMLTACYNTVEDAQAALTAMGVDGVVEISSEPTENVSPTNDIVAEIEPKGFITPPILSPPPGGPYVGPPIPVQGVRYTSVPRTETSEGSVDNVGFKIVPGTGKTHVTRKAGGAAKSNVGSRPRSSGSRGGGGGGRGGGGRRAAERPREEQAPDPVRAEKKKDKEKERYHSILNVLEDLTRAYEKAEKAADRAFGKARIKLLGEQEKELKKLAAVQKDYIDEINKFYEQDKANLEQVAAFAGVGIELNGYGTITNFDEIQDAMWNAYNSHINANDEVIGMDDEAWGKYEEEWGDMMDLIDQYEETQDLREEALMQLQEYINQLYDLQLEKVTYAVEIDIESAEFSLAFLDHLLGRIEDDAWSAAEAISMLGDEAANILEQNDTMQSGIRDILMNHTKDITDANGEVLKAADLTEAEVEAFLNGDEAVMEKIKNLGLEGGFTADEVETLKEYHEKLMEISESLIELREQVYATVLNAFEQFNEEMDHTISKMQHLLNITHAYRDIVDIVGKQNLKVSNTLLEAMGQSGIEQSLNILGSARLKKETIQSEIAAAEESLRLAKEQGLEEDVKLWEQNLKVMYDSLYEAEEEFMSSWAETMEYINEQFQLMVDNIAETFSDMMAGPLSKSLDLLQDAFNRHRDLDNLHLEDFEKIYEFSKLTRDITNSIDNTENVQAKRELAELQREINELEESGVEISQYQMENLRRRYELKVAELALLEAQNAKSQVQMQRDSDGNWNYVYTADSDTVSAAEQNYEDRLYALQVANGEYINTMQEMLIQTQMEMKAKIEEITADETLSMEEKHALIHEYTQYYMQKFNEYSAELGLVLDNNALLYEQDWTRYSELTGYKISADEEYVDKFNETVLSVVTGLGTMEEFNTNFQIATEAMLESLSDAFNSWSENVDSAMDAAGTSVDGFADDMSDMVTDVTNDSEELELDFKDLASNISTTFANITTATSNWASAHSGSIDAAIRKNDQLIASYGELLDAWSDYQTAINTSTDTSTDTSLDTKETIGTDGTGTGFGTTTDTGGGGGGEDGSEVSDEALEDAKTEKLKKGIAFAIWSHPNSGWGHGNSHVNLTSGERYDKLKEMGLDPNAVQQQINAYSGMSIAEMAKDSGIDATYANRAEALKDYTYNNFAFDTGGYTGAWNNKAGRWALLHEKELVLNKEDTSNMLKTIDFVRQIAQQIDINALSSAGFFTKDLIHHRFSGNGQTFEQEVHITAEFPNATDKNEIYAAFGELINLASQYANRR